VRHSVGREERWQDNAKGARTERRTNGLGAERFASNRNVAGELEGRESLWGSAAGPQVGIVQGITAVRDVPSFGVASTTFQTGVQNGGGGGTGVRLVYKQVGAAGEDCTMSDQRVSHSRVAIVPLAVALTFSPFPLPNDHN
jgi:hypothetical protein